jgi:hypothetical protein
VKNIDSRGATDGIGSDQQYRRLHRGGGGTAENYQVGFVDLHRPILHLIGVEPKTTSADEFLWCGNLGRLF